ncbi:MAG TPA: DUF4124 domain-containing protein [Luteimonas sp.]|nr:DUF4124 domain-containing protein [Luteimonas sp.]
MHRIVLGVALCLGALPGAHAQQTAGEVFQWKDANGTTHYSQTPPPSGAYQQRVINHTGNAAPVAVAGAATAPAESAQCRTARSNITALQGGTDVQQDTDGDGKPDKTLSTAERTGQLEFAQAAVKAYCTT